MGEKIYTVSVPVRTAQLYWVKAKSKKEAIKTVKDNMYGSEGSHEYGSIFSNKKIKVEIVGLSDRSDFFFGSATAEEIKDRK